MALEAMFVRVRKSGRAENVISCEFNSRELFFAQMATRKCDRL